MKIKNIFKVIASISVVTSVGLTIGLFVDLIPQNYSNVRILTKETYQKWTENKNVKIDYSTLPTSQYSLTRVLDNPKSINNGNFMFYFGSQAYAQTNLMLWGNNGKFIDIQGQSPIYTNSLIHKIYDSFWGENASKLGLDEIDLTFLNYVDIVDKKSYVDAWNLKRQRAMSGNFVTNELYKDSTGVPTTPPENLKNQYYEYTSPNGGSLWYKIDKFKWGVVENEEDIRDVVGVEVVKGITNDKSEELYNFSFEPDPTTYYEWRPDDKYDTEYQKVYYRNNDETKNFLNNFAFIESYLANVYQNSSASKEGMLICFRNINPDNYETTISNPFDIKVVSNVSSSQSTIGTTLDSIISFYNPDYIGSNEDSTNSDGSTDSSGSSSSRTTTTYYQKEYKNNVLNKNLNELNKNLSIIKNDEE